MSHGWDYYCNYRTAMTTFTGSNSNHPQNSLTQPHWSTMNVGMDSWCGQHPYIAPTNKHTYTHTHTKPHTKSHTHTHTHKHKLCRMIHRVGGRLLLSTKNLFTSMNTNTKDGILYMYMYLTLHELSNMQPLLNVHALLSFAHNIIII